MIIGLDRVRATDIPLVGGKGANLGELIAAGLPVPGGFCVTAEAYRSAMTPLREEIAGLLETGNHDRLRELVAAAPLPDGLADRIRTAAGNLDGPVAVRSSATAEDLPDASFAGQQETYLGVIGGDTVVDAVRRCWASAVERSSHRLPRRAGIRPRRRRPGGRGAAHGPSRGRRCCVHPRPGHRAQASGDRIRLGAR